MQTRSYDAALDFLPAEETARTGRPAGIVSAFKCFVAAIDAGLEAQHEYKTLVARGLPSAAAAEAAFRDHLDRK